LQLPLYLIAAVYAYTSQYGGNFTDCGFLRCMSYSVWRQTADVQRVTQYRIL